MIDSEHNSTHDAGPDLTSNQDLTLKFRLDSNFLIVIRSHSTSDLTFK